MNTLRNWLDHDDEQDWRDKQSPARDLAVAALARFAVAQARRQGGSHAEMVETTRPAIPARRGALGRRRGNGVDVAGDGRKVRA